MTWRRNLFLFIAVIGAYAAKAQAKGAPPYFEGSNVIRYTSALATLSQKVMLVKDSSRPIRVLHLGDSHVNSGYFAEAFADSLNRSFGRKIDDNQAIALTVMAKNGATSKHFLEVPYNATEVQQLHPDLIIISLGTNEAQNLFSLTELQTYFTALLAQIKSDAPDAALLFTTPGDALRKTTRQVKKKKRYYTVTSLAVNPVLPVVVNFIKDFAEKNNAAYWNWYGVMGGRGAIARWVGHGYANVDKIHLLEKGYNLQGWLLASAFVKFINTTTAHP